MKYLLYFYTSFNQKFLGSLLDEAISLSKDKNNEVYFAYCGGVNEICVFNNKGSKPVCKLCSLCTKRIISKYGIKAISLKDYIPHSITSVKFDYKNAEELRDIRYKGVNIGMSIMSTFISSTRNMSPLINDEARRFFDAHLDQNVRFVESLYALVDEIKPDYIYGYNGRFEDSRPVYDICKELKINSRLTEDDKVDGVSNLLVYENHLPHDIDYFVERRDYCWDHYQLSNEEKIELGKSFYIKRRGGLPSGDVEIYIKNQHEGYIPEFDDSKINIAIMNSSEDEYAAVGGEWDDLKFFKTQYEGIIYLLENAPSNVHFYLRIHPNLRKIKYRYHLDLITLGEKYSNITVIPASSEMSTYTIMEYADKIVVFGSTMGIESSYWGKPSILLGPATYYYDDLSYIPETREELISMLTEDLKPKFNENIYRFGAYTLDKSPLYKKYVNIDSTIEERKFLGFKFHTTPFMSLWYNEYFTNLVIGIGRALTDNMLFWRYKTPLIEE